MKNINYNSILKQTFSKLEKTLDRWKESDFERIENIYQLLNKQIDKELIKSNYSIIKAEYDILTERNTEALVNRVQVHFQHQIDTELATKIVNIIIFGTDAVSQNNPISQQIKQSHGLGKNRDTGDEVTNASGRFGFDMTNPIPLQGIDKINDYFAKLRLITGESISANRISSIKAENLDYLVDKYEIFNTEKKSVAILYVYAYHGSDSKKAPDGFLLIA